MKPTRTMLSAAIATLLFLPLDAVRAHGASAHANASPGLVDEVRRATQDFHDVGVAMAAGYASMGSCVSGPQEGAMGIHFVNGDLVGDGALDAQRPEALMYEARGGKLHFVGVEYIVPLSATNARNGSPPTLMGQSFHYTGAPNRYGIPAFYSLHVWAWKPNPHGTFVDWNPTVSCEDYTDAAAAARS